MFKVTGKKNGVKTTKTLTATVTVKPVTITADSEVTMSVGDSETLFTVKPSGKKLTTTSSNPEVATVDEYGNVVAVGVGTTTITASSKYTDPASEEVSIEVTVEAATVKITSLEATSASTLTATLSAAASTDATVSVTKSGTTTAVSGDVTFDTARTTVTFSTTANLTAGTYTMTLTDGDSTSSMDVTVEDEYVAEIVITSTTALTDPDAKTRAYIYYDVYNQYGESLRTSTSVSWSSSAASITADKSTGKLTLVSNDDFVYGNLIYVTGVYTKTGVSVSTSVPVGMEQALDTVEAVGFVNKNKPTELLTVLPTDFSKDTYYMVYETRDQDNNLLDASETNIADSLVTFVSDNILLVTIGSEEKIFTIDGVSYSSVAVEPGLYVDKGGEVNITAISNKTGNKSVTNFVVGEGVVLQSLSITGTSGVVADGDTWVPLSYTAKDTNGNSVTNYESIVRSTNTLNLTVSDGTLWVEENNDGTATIYWSDSTQEWSTSTTRDGVDRSVSLTTVVVGGTSDNYILSVSDKRRPVAIKSIDSSKTTVAAEGTVTIDFSDYYQVVYLDQYGADMTAPTAATFFEATENGLSVEQDSAAVYGVLADFTSDNDFVDQDDTQIYYSNSYVLTLTADAATAVLTDSVKFSIAQSSVSGVSTASSWSTAGKVKSESFTIVPVSKLSNIMIADVSTQQLKTEYSDYANGLEGGVDVKEEIGDDEATFVNGATLSVVGTYNGVTVIVPSKYYDEAESDDVTFGEDGFTLSAISSGALKWSALYNSSTSGLERKDATVSVSIAVYNSTSTHDADTLNGTVKKNITVSDAQAKVASVEIVKTTVNATNTEAELDSLYTDSIYNLIVKDQYGNTLYRDDEEYTISFSISDTVENTGDFAHIDDSLAVSKNSSADATLSGAELGDTFKLTITATGTDAAKTSVSATVDVTVGADTLACLSTAVDADKTLRATLGYDR